MAKTNVSVSASKYPYPELPNDASKEAKAEVLRIRAESTRNATRDIVNAVVNGADSDTLSKIRGDVAEALMYLADRASNRKGIAGEGVTRAPKSNVVAEYFADKTAGDKINAGDVFMDLDMDPARVLGSLKRFVSTVKDTSKRVWVSYDKASRSYIIAGYGAEAPAGFTAYAVELNASEA